MSNGQRPYEIRERADPEGGIELDLVVEGKAVASAKAQADVLADMGSMLGRSRDEVVHTLRAALEQHLKGLLDKVTIASPREIPGRERYFVSDYLHCHFGEIVAGVVWYDVTTGKTGPEEVPAIVRNRMRFEVHRKETEGSKTA